MAYIPFSIMTYNLLFSTIFSSGYIDWPFMTTHSWGENPHGEWRLEIHNDAYSKYAAEAKFFKWSLELYGIQFDPNSRVRLFPKCIFVD